MFQEMLYLVCFVLAVYASQARLAVQSYDEFNTPCDYLADPLGNSVGDDFCDLRAGENVDSFIPDMTCSGRLYDRIPRCLWGIAL